MYFCVLNFEIYEKYYFFNLIINLFDITFY
jgi:hypothetical protein